MDKHMIYIWAFPISSWKVPMLQVRACIQSYQSRNSIDVTSKNVGYCVFYFSVRGRGRISLIHLTKYDIKLRHIYTTLFFFKFKIFSRVRFKYLFWYFFSSKDGLSWSKSFYVILLPKISISYKWWILKKISLTSDHKLCGSVYIFNS